MEKELVSNRKAFYNYEIIETFEAGIVLLGTEIKSIKAGGGSLQDAFVTIKGEELFLINSHIAPYQFGSIYNHPEKRERKLLMHRKEILRLKKLVQEKGVTIIPLSFYLKNGMLKVKIAIAKGKKSHDKREAIKEREDKRAIAKALKHNPKFG
jgi:SsrA-binding protein